MGSSPRSTAISRNGYCPARRRCNSLIVIPRGSSSFFIRSIPWDTGSPVDPPIVRGTVSPFRFRTPFRLQFSSGQID